MAFLVPLSSPVLALQHVIIPTSLSSAGKSVFGVFSLFVEIAEGLCSMKLLCYYH